MEAADACWAYALNLYARRGVERACLELQDHCDLNINVLLFCLWMGHSGRAELTTAALAPVLTHCLQWHDAVVAPLRRLRRRLRDDPIVPGVSGRDRRALRRRLLRDELTAERVAHRLLCASLTQPPQDAVELADRCQTSINNIACYVRRWGDAPLDAVGQQAMSTLLSIAYDTLPGRQIHRKALQARLISPGSAAAR